MAVAAADLAYGDLRTDALEAPLAPAEGHHRARLRPDVVELENHEISLAAVDAAGRPQGVEDHANIAAARRVQLAQPFLDARAGAKPSRPLCRDAAMAVGAAHLTARDFAPDALRPGSASQQRSYGVAARENVVELEDSDVALTAVDTRMTREVSDDDGTGRRGPPPLRQRHLPTMQVTSRPEVRAEAFSAPVLPSGAHAVERLQRQILPASATSLRHEHMFAYPSDGMLSREG
jgi:hypothetical protein